MKYFTIEELSRSSAARERGIENIPTSQIKVKLQRLIDNLLDPARERFGKPITVNSGYRSFELNRAVGGAPTSQHMRGEAVDITAGSPAENRKLFAILETMDYDQLINERDMTWIHVSYKTEGNRRQKLKL